MKLAVLVEFFPPKLGSDRRIYEIMKRLSNGHQVHFVVFPPFRMLSGKLPEDQKDFRWHFKRQEGEKVEDDIVGHFVTVPHFFLKLWRKSEVIAYFLTMTFLFPRVIKTLRKVNPNIVVLNYPSAYTGALGYFCCRVLGRRALLDFNDLIAQYTISLLNLRSSCLKAKLLISIQDHIVKKCDKIVTTLNYIKTYALKLGVENEKVFVVPNGVDIELFNPRKFDIDQIKSELNLDGKYICIYCGRLDKWAGTDMVVDLSRKCEGKNPNIQFVVVGADSPSKTSKNLVMLKQVRYEHVPKFLAMADIILIPFPENEVSHATSPLKLLEAMSMGKSVIASKVKGIEEIVQNGINGILVESHDVNQWYEAISFIMKSKPLAKRMSTNARLSAEKSYDWNFLAKQYGTILQQIA